MVAGGVGLAPFLTLAEALHARGTSTTLFYGARRAAELYQVDLFERLGVRVVLTTEDGSRGAKGLVTGPLGDALATLDAREQIQLYVCGPTPMMRAVATAGQNSTGDPALSRSSRSWVADSAAATAASS